MVVGRTTLRNESAPRLHDIVNPTVSGALVAQLWRTSVNFLCTQEGSRSTTFTSAPPVCSAIPVIKLDKLFLYSLDKVPALTSLDPACILQSLISIVKLVNLGLCSQEIIL
ncbi:hypothetical protein PR048_010349 [Dryococelus australis]|uniref:Uncharacterized protein n=1 Tax=Dryococelus australis TaxID=614101 RepID=A0ABQ9I2G9_9NEOP|nr:hypothetical protein PR048_010349 [Dryococelus australis]